MFLLTVFFFFSFFSSACEFRFIERIGTYGKQNPDFIIIIKSKLMDLFLVRSMPVKENTDSEMLGNP